LAWAGSAPPHFLPGALEARKIEGVVRSRLRRPKAYIGSCDRRTADDTDRRSSGFSPDASRSRQRIRSTVFAKEFYM